MYTLLTAADRDEGTVRAAAERFGRMTNPKVLNRVVEDTVKQVTSELVQLGLKSKA